MKKAFNTSKTNYFVLLPEVLYKQETSGPNAGKMVPAIGSFSFRDYTDRTGALGRGTGVAVQYVVSKDDRGRDKGKFFTLSQSHNAFMVNDTDRDLYGTRMIEFIANSPFCEGSPNGSYKEDANGNLVQTNVMYRLLNDEKDAEVALEASLNRSKAQLSANEIDEQTLLEVATIGIGYNGKPDKIMRHRVVEWAGKRPKDYFEVLNSGDRLVRALIRKAIADNIFTVKGELIYWASTLIGTDEDSAVKKLVDDKDLLSGLQEKVDLKIKTAEDKPKKPKK
jgi:hypothetical protein